MIKILVDYHKRRTGFACRDVTPEATKAVCGRMAPGIAEAMRYKKFKGYTEGGRGI